jgi:hypothetical protein
MKILFLKNSLIQKNQAFPNTYHFGYLDSNIQRRTYTKKDQQIKLHRYWNTVLWKCTHAPPCYIKNMYLCILFTYNSVGQPDISSLWGWLGRSLRVSSRFALLDIGEAHLYVWFLQAGWSNRPTAEAASTSLCHIFYPWPVQACSQVVASELRRGNEGESPSV